jgi:hypothetical protein
VEPTKNTNRVTILTVAIFILLSLGVIVFLYYQNQELKKMLVDCRVTPQASSSASPKACTLEAKICPDGSSVGRTGPNCEFAPCPTP